MVHVEVPPTEIAASPERVRELVGDLSTVRRLPPLIMD